MSCKMNPDEAKKDAESSENCSDLCETGRRRKRHFSNCQPIEEWKATMRQRAVKSVEITRKYNSLDIGAVHGSAFNIAFKEQSKLCAVMYELATFKLFDSRLMRCVSTVTAAHDGCVNCARFVEPNLLVTGSDDCTLAVWDLRKLDNKVSRLIGHTGWVKSVEYDRTNNLLLTGAFDKEMRVWDLQRASGEVLHASTVVRFEKKVMRICFDDAARRLVVANTGQLTVVNDLDVTTPGFLSIPAASVNPDARDDDESLRRNRVSLIGRAHFPKRSRKLWNVSSLDLLPSFDGSPSQCCVSRSTYLRSSTLCLWVTQLDHQSATVVDSVCIHDVAETVDPTATAEIDTNCGAQSSHVEKPPSTVGTRPDRRRLIYSRSESAVPSGYIKEISASSSGRLIASPSGAAVNIFAISAQIGALDRWTMDEVAYVERRTRTLALVKRISMSTMNAVLCSRFSPAHEPGLLVTGSANGDVHFIDTVL